MQDERDVVGVHHLAVVAQRLHPRRLLIGRRQGQVANLEQFRRGEEHHVGRKAVDGIQVRALLDYQRIEPELACRDGRRQPRRARPHNEHISQRHQPMTTWTPSIEGGVHPGQAFVDGEGFPHTSASEMHSGGLVKNVFHCTKV